MKFVSAVVLLAGACNAFVPSSPKASFVVSPVADVTCKFKLAQNLDIAYFKT